jgi:hypothetical protein
VPVTVAEHVAVCPVEMADGVAVTVTLVTVGCTAVLAMFTFVLADFVSFCVEVANMVSVPVGGGFVGAV